MRPVPEDKCRSEAIIVWFAGALLFWGAIGVWALT
jgi:hypothetical protein